MTCRRCAVLGLAVLAAALSLAPAASGQAGSSSRCTRLEGSADGSARPPAGVELAGVRRTAAGIRAEAVLTRAQRAKLAASGREGHADAQRARARRSPSRPRLRRPAASTSGARGTSPAASATSCYAIARENPQLVKLEVLGQHAPGPRADRAQGHAGRARRARRLAPGGAVLVAAARARVDQPRGQPPAAAPLHRRLATRNDKEIRRSARRRTELWFVIVANPDGYQYTFDARPAVAQEPARQQRQRADHRRRRRRSRTATSPSTGATTTRARRPTRPTRPTAGRAPRRSPRRGRCRA